MERKNTLISVVIPIYGCEHSLIELTERLIDSLEKITENFEVFYVNDASPDGAWQTINKLCRLDNRIKGINLSRNFGQHNAITAGLDRTIGEWVVVMDGDLQDRPEEIIRLYEKAQNGYDIVFATRVERQDTFFKKLSSKIFYTFYNYLAERSSDNAVANFSISSKKVIESFRQMREQNRIYPLFIQWMGFDTAYIPVHHQQRRAGKSSYNIKKLFKLATDVIISQSNKPLRFSIQIGLFIAILSFIYGVYLFVRYFFLAEHVPGWTSLMVSIFFLGGLILFNLGIIGLYLGKVFNETKARPLYFVKEEINMREEIENERFETNPLGQKDISN